MPLQFVDRCCSSFHVLVVYKCPFIIITVVLHFHQHCHRRIYVA